LSERFTRLVYLSTCTRDLSEDDLGAILTVSRRNNERDGITGVLAFHRGCFVQVLEGPPAAVDAAMARIRQDDRHHHIFVCRQVAPSRRLFGGWSMGWISPKRLAGSGFDPAALRLPATRDAVVDGMLDMFRSVVAADAAGA
jgi:hypothetical protein